MLSSLSTIVNLIYFFMLIVKFKKTNYLYFPPLHYSCILHQLISLKKINYFQFNFEYLKYLSNKVKQILKEIKFLLVTNILWLYIDSS